MKVSHIPLESLTPRGNKTQMDLVDNQLSLTCPKPLDKNCGRAVIPIKFKIPFRVNLTLKADATNFNILMGNGYVHFSHAPNESGNGMRRQDIFTGKEEPTKYDYDAKIPLDEYFDLSVVVGEEITWVEINGNCYYSTRKASYIGLLEENMPVELEDGLEIAVGVGKIGDKKGTHLMIKSVEVVEYENDELAVPEEIIGLPHLSSFEWYLKSLPADIRQEVENTDDYLMNEDEIKSIFKFKRAIDKHGNTSYTSACGLQYRLLKYEESGKHSGKHVINWVQKPNQIDYTSEILTELSAIKPEFADQLVANMTNCGKTTCRRNAVVVYKGQSKRTCSNMINFKWSPSELDEVRDYIKVASHVISRK